MAVETQMTPEQEELAERARQAVAEAARQLVLRTPVADADAQGPDGLRNDALASLQALAYLGRAVEECAALAARAAAQEGAGLSAAGQGLGCQPPGRPQALARTRLHRPPRITTATPRPDPEPPHERPRPRTYTVLLVEDDMADAMLIEEALTEQGMARGIQRADDGVAALEYLRDPRTDRPDLIVLDLNMPRMNGRELLNVLKNDPDLSSIPIVVLTTSAAPDDIDDAYRQHANAYVTKPVNLDDFIETVQSIDSFFFDTATTLPRRTGDDL